MPRSKRYYQRKAETCVARAETVRDPQERAAILGIAQLYMKLSEHVSERHEGGTVQGRRY